MSKVPLFLLNTVLFPGGQIVLHVFEDRYRKMISRCLQESRPFGVVLIKEGPEVGGLAVPHSVGTMASITSAYALSDGRIYLTATGLHRFRIQYILQTHPYPVGSVTTLAEESGERPQELAAEIAELYERYRTAIMVVGGSSKELENLPDDPLTMSYMLASRMHVPLQHKQRWLEADVATRLREIGAALRYELRLLPDSEDQGDEQHGKGSWN
ncbi:MAG: peptidase S16 [Herpetosiphonaceae bacterium]|nr:MAG: peptidase S16 [Herpetosiphonaceae bacterium]